MREPRNKIRKKKPIFLKNNVWNLRIMVEEGGDWIFIFLLLRSSPLLQIMFILMMTIICRGMRQVLWFTLHKIFKKFMFFSLAFKIDLELSIIRLIFSLLLVNQALSVSKGPDTSTPNYSFLDLKK